MNPQKLPMTAAEKRRFDRQVARAMLNEAENTIQLACRWLRKASPGQTKFKISLFGIRLTATLKGKQ